MNQDHKKISDNISKLAAMVDHATVLEGDTEKSEKMGHVYTLLKMVELAWVVDVIGGENVSRETSEDQVTRLPYLSGYDDLTRLMNELKGDAEDDDLAERGNEALVVWRELISARNKWKNLRGPI